MSSRHSSYPHQPEELAQKTRQFEPHRAGVEGPASGPFSGDRAEELAETMIAVGSDYMAHKAEAKFGADNVPTGPAALLGVPPEAVANKIIKEAAREMERAEGTPHKGSPAALAQAVAAHRDDPSAPEHAVAEKIRERVAAAEDRAEHPSFVGVNPDVGLEHHQKERHMRHAQEAPYAQGLAHTEITGGFRGDGNPDVLPPNPHKHAREHAARPHGAGAAP